MIAGADAALGGHVDRLRPAVSLDSYGDAVDDWTAPTVARLIGATVQAPPGTTGASTETETASADTIKNTRRLFAPGAADLTAADRIRYEGEVWRVDGDPVIRRGLGSVVYTTAQLTRTETR